MEPERTSSLMGRLFLWVGISLLAIVVYVGSAGPVIMLVPESGPWRAVNKVYAPFIWMMRNTQFGKPLEAYLEWWARLRKK